MRQLKWSQFLPYNLPFVCIEVNVSLEENNALVLHYSSLKIITLIFYSVQLYYPSLKEIEVERPLNNHLVSNNTGE